MTAPERELCRRTEFLDYESSAVSDFLEKAVPARAHSQRELAIALYYAVRDRVEYEIYGADLSREGFRASQVVARGRGLCIHKSVLYAACVRALGIPSRLIFVDVRNHLASERLKSFLGGDVFRYHCLTRVFIDGRWVKATPVFTAKLCLLYRIAPLDFDGQTDSVLHSGDEAGMSSMELVHDHGEFDDLPYQTVTDGLRSAHPMLFDGPARLRRGSLVVESRPGAER